MTKGEFERLPLGLFNEAFFLVIMKCKECGRIRSCASILRYYPRIFPNGLSKIMKNLSHDGRSLGFQPETFRI
jgi:hypothetical protein